MLVEARTAYPLTAAGPRVRIAQFAEPLARLGVDCRLSSTLTDEEYRVVTSPGRHARKAYVLARGATGLRGLRAPPGSVSLVHRLLSLIPVPGLDPPRELDVYDFDDALFVPSANSPNRGLGQLVKREGARWYRYVSRARLVLAGNAYLAAEAARYARGIVEIVPSCVEPDDYISATHDDDGIVRVGWIGSASTAPYLAPVVEAVRRLVDRSEAPEVRLVVIGANLSIDAPWLEDRHWSFATQAAELARLDIGVMPLPDDEWSRGKCGYKLLQYFAAGVPGIASPVGVAAELLKGGDGIPARTAVEFERAITQLALDPAARRERGARARAYVEAEFSYGRWAPELAEAFSELV